MKRRWHWRGTARDFEAARGPDVTDEQEREALELLDYCRRWAIAHERALRRARMAEHGEGFELAEGLG